MKQVILSLAKGMTFLFMWLFSLCLFAQNITVSGRVTDTSGEPLIGVTVQVQGTTIGTVTNIDGNFTLSNLPSNAAIEVSYVGMQTQLIDVAGRISINITLREDTEILDEIVVVGYGTQRRSTLTGSIADVKSDQLTVTPAGNITNALTGKLPGLITTQSMGLPGSDQANLNIRGFGAPLVIVDGIEAGLTNLDPSQVESISILKDGASSIYGARAGNGVVLISTKRGVTQKPTITLNASYTMQGVTNMAKTLSSGQFAELSRESHLNAGNPEETAPYTAEEVAKYYAGNDPAYPSSDWYGFTFRDWAPQQNYNLSIRGGSEKIKYMGYLGYQKQETMIRKNGGDYQRFNILSNIDATITENLLLTIDLMAAYEFRKFTGRGLENGDGIAWQDLYSTRPWYPTALPDPEKNASGGADVGSVALSTDMDIWGYNQSKPKDLRGAITLILRAG
ncbi:MAG: SusC/RagA family TonB-linked outer membrane protein [Tannerellaceae bacterium]|jgi:TonB-linked SusC/RagA family outer membrane protein|nr:SusC/RagA family TonB-linked outer membrane protein [Tannerellaceae bacterium]